MGEQEIQGLDMLSSSVLKTFFFFFFFGSVKTGFGFHVLHRNWSS